MLGLKLIHISQGAGGGVGGRYLDTILVFVHITFEHHIRHDNRYIFAVINTDD